MKYILLLGDGMADHPLQELSNLTPLQYAKKPNIDRLASLSTIGMVQTVPENMSPGSDVANLSVLGYSPKLYYTGRSPLEAASIGIELNSSDVAIRTNFVTLSDHKNFEDKVMLDYCADEISTEESNLLIETLNQHFKTNEICFYTGVSYRHCMIWKFGLTGLHLTPPHDIQNQTIGNYLPSGTNVTFIVDMIRESYSILKDHPVNVNRIKKGLRPANAIWLWGEGKKTTLPDFTEKWNMSGAMISAVDLLRGLGQSAGMQVIDVEGATGNLHTNYLGKAKATIQALKNGVDFVYIHVEAPDECGHRGEIQNKVTSIEWIDEKLLGPLLKDLEEFEDYKLLILPDHPTPVALRRHTNEAVPFLLYQKSNPQNSGIDNYNEFTGKKNGLMISQGNMLLDYFIKNKLHN